VLIEDNGLMGKRLAALLEGQLNCKVVATAPSATMGLAQVQRHTPHVALVDAAVGNRNRDLCLESVRMLAPEARVVLMNVQPEREDIIAFIAAGANGFVLRDATVDDLVTTLRVVAEGTDVAPGPLIPTLFSYFADQVVPRPQPRASEPGARFTKREREITDLIASGLANKEIAQRLDIATHTVKSHVHNILDKLGLRSRLQVAIHTQSAASPTTPGGLGASEVVLRPNAVDDPRPGRRAPYAVVNSTA
jgi:DNA-binding NarL/FixJ family response regulator